MQPPKPGCRYILTGTPGCGKTALIRQLEVHGFSVVEEAATDVIAASHANSIEEPWRNPQFIETITELQRTRQLDASLLPGEVQFHDRSVVCTAALATYLGYPIPPVLAAELDRIVSEAVFERSVFFLRNLGFIAPTAARRISFEESLRFERIHEETYRSFGFELHFIDAAPIPDRIAAIRAQIRALN
ncbi:ATP/GTP-binding protein [Occallatibacter riparius]|uniref:AAA family ATPase n=1 Tax=Occallatibacter riparius TaxID=1002689 RepID=A0A9J7BTT9_9BACT|nr:AAA family ATPase [Occallatibacter riparius]UWZ86064.1 AAA family ATPase [Occallatibacter riparius]